MLQYRVLVDDNYHFMDPGERCEQCTYDSLDEALAACRRLVDLSLEEGYQAGITAEELYGYFKGFGDDPFIVVAALASPAMSLSRDCLGRPRARSSTSADRIDTLS
jgi:hypothetical protein